MTNLEILKNAISEWNGELVVDSNVINADTIDFTKSISVRLNPIADTQPIISQSQDTQETVKIVPKTSVTDMIDGNNYRISVRSYMTKKASLEFDFMAKWNNDNPMPLATMSGTVVKQTKGMVYMVLHGEALPIVRCMRCGKTLSNPISRKYGLGVECIQKVGIVADINDVDDISEQLQKIVWEGWIIKSAITECEGI